MVSNAIVLPLRIKNIIYFILLLYEKKNSYFFVVCWLVRDVTAAMLVVKNKSISLLWELNSIFM